jgi:hypothetical protein
MYRNCCLLVMVLACVFAAGLATAEASHLDANTMKAALKTATPEEDGFIDRTLALVEKGSLPVDMVESTFLWAKKKARRKFQYFKFGLIVRAERAGVRL